METASTDSVDKKSSANEHEEGKFELKRKIGLWGAVAIIAGSVVGSGIFVSPVGVLEGTNGSVGISLILWIACGLFSALASLCYAELGTTILESGSEFTYLNVAYGGPLAFMYIVCFMIIISPSSDAAKAIVFGTYLATPFYPGCDPPESAVKCAAVASVLFLGLVNYLSVSSATRVQIIFTVAKFIGMLMIVVGGLTRLGMGDPVGITNFQNAFDPVVLAGITASQIGLAFYQGLFSYNGWNKLNYLSEEVKNVGTTLPRSIMISLGICTLFYILVNIAYLSGVVIILWSIIIYWVTDNTQSPGPKTVYYYRAGVAALLSRKRWCRRRQVSNNTQQRISTFYKAVAVTFAARVFPNIQWIMPLLVSLSVFGSINGSLLTGGRVVFAAARREHLPQVLSMVHVSHKTPAPAIIVQVGMILIQIIPGNIDSLISITSFTAWIFYGLCAVAVLILRRKFPDLPRPYRVPTAIPVIVIIFDIYLIIAPLVSSPELAYAYGIIVMLCTPIIYYPFVHFKYRIPGMDKITVFLQKFFDISPTDWKDQLANANHED